MELFRTVLTTGEPHQSLSLNDTILTAGSCFSDAIGKKLQRYKIHTLANPFGNIYNPHSIHKLLRHSILTTFPSDDTYLENQGIYLNYDLHSEFSSASKPVLMDKLNQTVQTTHQFLKNASYLIITYGTAWVYERIDNGEIVANCHKMPANYFKKSLLTQKKIIESFNEFYTTLKTFNPAIRIILTVSPVRHLKDTLTLNSVSKSVLRLSCHTLTESFTDVDYFPAYEIMMDDLRDYRFYKPDMLHPSEEAEEYIWQRFTEKYCDEKTNHFFKKWKTILAALSHKPFNPQSVGHQKFLKETFCKLEELKAWVNVDTEMDQVKQQLI